MLFCFVAKLVLKLVLKIVWCDANATCKGHVCGSMAVFLSDCRRTGTSCVCIFVCAFAQLLVLKAKEGVIFYTQMCWEEIGAVFFKSSYFFSLKIFILLLQSSLNFFLFFPKHWASSEPVKGLKTGRCCYRYFYDATFSSWFWFLGLEKKILKKLHWC